jgi:DNA polymerase V
MSSRSFSKETEDMVVIKDAVAYHLRQALTNLRRIQCKTGLIRVHLLTSRHGDFLLRGGSAERCLSLPSNESRSLLAVANELIEEIYEPGVPYKKVGISLQNLFPDKVSQSTLFESNNDNDKSESWQAVDELISKLNQKGRDTILLGSRLKEGVWQAKKESRSPAYTTSWEDIAEVKA